LRTKNGVIVNIEEKMGWKVGWKVRRKLWGKVRKSPNAELNEALAAWKWKRRISWEKSWVKIFHSWMMLLTN